MSASPNSLDCARWLSRQLLLLLLPLVALAGERIPVQFLFEVTGTAHSSFEQPTDIAIANERLYVLDGINRRVAVFDLDGKFLFELGDDASLERPVGLCVDPGGRVYLADAAAATLHLFGEDGRHRGRMLISAVEQDAAPDITDCSVSDAGEIFLVDNDNHRIHVYDAEGARRRWWGEHGEHEAGFRYPATIDRDAAGTLYVVDVMNSVVKGFDPSGSLQVRIGGWGITPGRLFRPKGVMVVDTRVFVSDSYTGVLQVFRTDGSFVGVIAEEAGTPLRFKTPTNMALSGNRLYVVEQLMNRVSVWDIDEAHGSGAASTGR